MDLNELTKAINEEGRPLIVGSGPSGLTAAVILIELGYRPVMVDAHQNWNKDSNLDRTLSQMFAKGHLNDYSTYYQSEFSNTLYDRGILARQSFSFGGFSRVWGGTVDFSDEISSWQPELIPNEADYQVVGSILGVDVSSSHHTYSDFHQITHDRRLNLKRFLSKESLIAIEQSGPKACINLGLCIKGCPVDSIWFAGNKVNELIERRELDYLGEIFLNKLEEGNQKPILEFKSRKFGDFKLSPRKAYLGLGPIGTASVLIRSDFEKEYLIKDSRTVFTASISLTKMKESNGHTLSKFWLKSREKGKLTAQIYDPSLQNKARLLLKYPILRFLNFALEGILLRLQPAVIYHSSSNSDSIVVKKMRDSIIVKGNARKKAKFKAYWEMSKLALELISDKRLLLIFGGFGKPGTGFHSGSFLECGNQVDHLGAILKDIHIIDSSVLPELPVGSITPTIMVNAARIVRQTNPGNGTIK
jgi:ferredoxin